MGVTLYFSRFSKQDIDTKHNSEPNADLSTHDMFNEILANRDAQLTTELARFVTEFTDYRVKFNAELTSLDEKFTAEVQRIFTMLNTSTAIFDEIEQVLQDYHNNFGRVATEFESINGSISMLQNEINRYYAVVHIPPEIIEPIEEAELRDNDSSSSDQQSDANQSEASSDSSQRSFSDITSEMWRLFSIELWQRGDVLLTICVIL